MNPFPFPHKQLDVYNVALHMAIKTKRLAAHVPRGYRSFADQFLRAAGATVLLIAEGANRFSSGSKRQRYSHPEGAITRTPALSGAPSIRSFTPIAWVDVRLPDLGFTDASMQPEPSNLPEVKTEIPRHQREKSR